MVARSDITLNNTSLLSPGSGPTVAVLGGTGGIGLSTIQAVLKNTSTPTIYIVGRSIASLNSLIATLTPLNASATIVPVEGGDLTLVASAQKAAKTIASKASKLDLVVMSPGYLSFDSHAVFSSEGLDKITAIRYHVRMRFLLTLLPLLRAAPNPRVISILAGGQEGIVHLDDLGMTDETSYGILYAANASAAYNTLFLEELSQQKGNEKIVFFHNYPGIVATGLKLQDSGKFMGWLYDWVLKTVLSFFSMPASESGERVLFAATNGRFRRLGSDEERERAKGTLIQEGSNGVLGSGVYTLGGDCEVVGGKSNKSLVEMRKQGAAAKIYEYTLAEMERIENMSN